MLRLSLVNREACGIGDARSEAVWSGAAIFGTIKTDKGISSPVLVTTLGSGNKTLWGHGVSTKGCQSNVLLL